MAEAVFCEEALRTHNMYREKHGAPGLKLSARLCKTAQEWAEALLNMPVLQNSPLANQGDVGENISMRRGSDVVDIGGEEVTTQWYNDVSKYDFQKGLGEAGNFTQLVWISTTEVGYGKARSRDATKCIVVAHYAPPGNVIGHYVQNVKPLAVQAEKEREKEKIRIDIGLKNDKPSEKKKQEERSELSKPSEKVTVERAVSPSGREYVVRRSVREARTPDGNVVRKIKEIEFKDERAAMEYARVDASSSESSDDEALMDGSKTTEERRRLKELTKFRSEVRKIHNQYRKQHGIDRVKRNRELDLTAQKWAEQLLQQPSLANSNQLYKGTRVGENIASRRSNAPCDYSAQEVVEHWYSENRKYDFDTEPRDVQGIGNFTQVAWRSTKELGIGKAMQTEANGATRVVVVCHYYPAGNVLTQFMDNVYKPK